jgi:hypothetical protein
MGVFFSLVFFSLANTHDVNPTELAQWSSMKQAMRELSTIQAAGADISRLIAGLSAFVAKGTASAINSAADHAQNISQGSTFRAMSPEYKRATVLLGVLERHFILQAASLKRYSVEELLIDGIKLPSAFNDLSVATKEISGAEAALLHDIAIMEILSSGTPTEKSALVEEYGDVLTVTYSKFDGQIINMDWYAFGAAAAAGEPVTVFTEMMLFLQASRMNDVQGINVLRELFNDRWNRYLDALPLIEALEAFGSAALVGKFAGNLLKSALKSSSRSGLARTFLKNEKKHFTQDLIDETRYLLDVADKLTPAPKPLFKNRKAISKAFIAGRPSSKTKEFFNFTGAESIIPNIIEGSKNAIVKSANPDFLVVKNADDYLAYLEKTFYKGAEALDPRMRIEIKNYLDNAQKNNLSIPFGPSGAPGLHAEVRAANEILKNNPGTSISQISIATVKLKGPGVGDAFDACQNCSGILKRFEILTGTTP